MTAHADRAAPLRVVHDVIVHERREVDQFDDDGEIAGAAERGGGVIFPRSARFLHVADAAAREPGVSPPGG